MTDAVATGFHAASLSRSHLRITAFLTRTQSALRWRMLAQQCARSAFWCGLAFAVPMALRGRLGLRGDVLAIACAITVLICGLVLTPRKHLRLGQVVAGLGLTPDGADRMAGAVEFLADPDPFKRLALREAEQWLDAHEPEIRCLWNWPFEARLAPVSIGVLLLAWVLTSPARAALPQFAGTGASQ